MCSHDGHCSKSIGLSLACLALVQLGCVGDNWGAPFCIMFPKQESSRLCQQYSLYRGGSVSPGASWGVGVLHPLP